MHRERPVTSSPRVRRRTRAALAIATVALTVAAPAVAATASLERATDAVVAITAGADRIGTGVVIAEDRVLTVAHVIDAAVGSEARVLGGGRLATYRVIGIDRERDLALLEADVPADVPAVVWGDSAALVRGQDVIVLGFPIGLSSVSLTKGVVSSPEQRVQGMFFIQTDAAINPGNSGGPLVDERGRLVGVNVAKVAEVSVDAVGFSIPAADVLDFLTRAEPGIRILVDTSPVGESAEAVTRSPAGARSPAPLTIALAIGLPVLVAIALLEARRRRHLAMTRAPLAEPAPDTAPRRTRPRAVVRVAGPERDEELDLRLPAIGGSAPNADVPIRAADANAYQVRFAPAGGTVVATNLTDATGMYCADACVRTVELRPGDHVRFGATTITLVRTYEG